MDVVTFALAEQGIKALTEKEHEVWSFKSSLSTTLVDAAAAPLPGNKVLVCGGKITWSSSNISDKTLVYDANSDTWTERQPMPVGKTGASADAIEPGKVLVVGGLSIGTQYGSNTVELYDYGANMWVSKAPRPADSYEYTNSQDSTTTKIAPGVTLTVAGGYSSGYWRFSRDVHRYDLASNTWTERADTLIDLSAHTAVSHAERKVLVAGGGSTNLSSRYLYLFDDTSNTWTRLADMLTPRRGRPSSRILSNGKMIVAGGINDDNPSLSSVEFYDITANVWEEGGYMPEPRARAASAPLDGDRMLIAGGSSSGLTGSVLMFSPYPFEVYHILRTIQAWAATKS